MTSEEKKSCMHEILLELHLLSIVKENQKLNVRDLTTISSWGFFQSVYRYFTSEDRRLTLIWLAKLSKRISDEILLIDNFEAHLKLAAYKLLQEKLIEALIGLKNLLITYTKIDSTCDTCDMLARHISDFAFFISYVKSKCK